MIDNFDIKLISSDGTETTLTSEDVVQVDSASFTDITQTGELHLKLNCEHGKFLTSAPLLEDWMKIKVVFKDQFGNTQSRIYEIQSYIESADDNSVAVTIIALSREYHLTQINFGQQFYQGNAYDVVKELINEYNTNKGPLQVTIDKHNDNTSNQLPQTNLYNYQFTTNEVPYKDGLMVVMNTTNLPIGAGGYGDYFALVFEDDPADDDKMIFKAFVSGSIPDPIPIFEQSSQRPIQSVVTRKEVPDATVVHVKAHPEAGTFPVDLSIFQGILEQFALLPDYVAGREYKKGERVKYGVKRYEAKVDTNSVPTTAASWDAIVESDVLGAIQYSPWTADKAYPFKNMMGKPDGVIDFSNDRFTIPNFTYVQAWDANMCIRTPDLWRDWVDYVSNDPSSIPANWKRGGQFYRTFKVLCVFSCANFGFPNETNAILQYSDDGWKIYRRLKQAGEVGDDGITRGQGDEVAIIQMAEIWKYRDGAITPYTVAGAHDCFHPVEGLQNATGIMHDIPNGNGGTYGDNSAVLVGTEYQTKTIVFDTSNSSYYGVGWWSPLFRAPYPNYGGGISEDVGDLYHPETLRLENMSYTHSGKTSFIHKESEDLLVIQAISFAFRFDVWYRTDFSPVIDPDDKFVKSFMGDVRFAIFGYDSNGTMKTPYTLPTTFTYQDVTIPLPFSTYRPVRPIREDATDDLSQYHDWASAYACACWSITIITIRPRVRLCRK